MDGVDTAGFPVETTGASFAWYASRREVSGQERFAAEQNSASAESEWQGSYRADMDPERVDVPKVFRFLYLGRVYDIVAARVVGDRKAIELTTLAKVG